MTGRQVLWFRMSGTALAVAVGANCVLIPMFGIVGAAMATSLALGLLFLAGLRVVRRELGLWPYDQSYLAMAIAAAVASIPLLLLRAGLLPSTALGLLVALAASGALMIATLWVRGLPLEDREFLAVIRRKIVST